MTTVQKFRYRVLLGLVLVVFVGISSGCSKTDAPPGRFEELPIEKVVENTLEIFPNATPETLAFLDQIVAKGEMTFQDYAYAIENIYGKCLTDGGLIYRTKEHTSRGVTSLLRVITYERGSQITDEQIQRVMHSCDLGILSQIEIVYISQASSIRAEMNALDEYRDRLIACIKETGTEISPTPSYDELYETSNRTSCDYETGFADSGSWLTDPFAE